MARIRDFVNNLASDGFVAVNIDNFKRSDAPNLISPEGNKTSLSSAVQVAVQKIRGELEAKEDSHEPHNVEIGGRTIRCAVTKASVFVRKGDLKHLVTWSIGEARYKKNTEISQRNIPYVDNIETKRLLNILDNNPTIAAIWQTAQQLPFDKPLPDDLQGKKDKNNIELLASDTLTYQGITLRFVCLRKTSRWNYNPRIYLHEDDVEQLSSLLPQSDRTTAKRVPLIGWMKRFNLTETQLIDSPLVQAYLPENETLTPDDLPEPFQTLDIDYRTQAQHGHVLHIVEEQLPLVAQYFHAIMPGEETQYVDKEGTAKALDTNIYHPTFSKAWSALEATMKEVKDGEAVKLNGQQVDVRKKHHGAMTRSYLNRDEVERFGEMMKEGIETNKAGSASISFIMDSIRTAPKGGGRKGR